MLEGRAYRGTVEKVGNTDFTGKRQTVSKFPFCHECVADAFAVERWHGIAVEWGALVGIDAAVVVVGEE